MAHFEILASMVAFGTLVVSWLVLPTQSQEHALHAVPSESAATPA